MAMVKVPGDNMLQQVGVCQDRDGNSSSCSYLTLESIDGSCRQQCIV